MSYGNYVQGNVDTNANAYNLLISGAPSGYTSSGINIGGDTSTTYGVKIANDASNNAFMDLRGDSSNKISFRHKDNASGSVSSMLDLTNDSALSGSGYGATVNGRVNASSYYVGQVDTRAPVNSGVYMGTDGNVGYFNINKGSGTGGFAFNTYNANGSLLHNNLNLKASGIVQAAYYSASENAADNEEVAVAGFDASGNLVRNYAANARFRSIEERLTTAESEVNGPVSTKVNEVISRLNGLNFFSQNISALPTNPEKVTNVQAISASSTSISVSFTADNQSISFIVTSSPGGFTASGVSSPITVTGLTQGTQYTFRVVASNAAGNSPTSDASNSVAPASAFPIIYPSGKTISPNNGQPQWWGGGQYDGSANLQAAIAYVLAVSPNALAAVWSGNPNSGGGRINWFNQVNGLGNQLSLVNEGGWTAIQFRAGLPGGA